MARTHTLFFGLLFSFVHFVLPSTCDLGHLVSHPYGWCLFCFETLGFMANALFVHHFQCVWKSPAISSLVLFSMETSGNVFVRRLSFDQHRSEFVDQNQPGRCGSERCERWPGPYGRNWSQTVHFEKRKVHQSSSQCRTQLGARQSLGPSSTVLLRIFARHPKLRINTENDKRLHCVGHHLSVSILLFAFVLVHRLNWLHWPSFRLHLVVRHCASSGPKF